jgi:LPXTG-motif cell wall-anchored protein
VPVGRVLTGTSRSQTQILAGSSDSTVSGTATANWAGRGAIPAFTAAKNCAEGGVGITVTNHGDQDFTFELAGGEHTVAAGESRTLTVPVDEDQAYDIPVTGPSGLSETFRGILDCATAGASAPAPATEEPSSAQPSAASVGGLSVDGSAGLAETGSSGATPVIAGIAIALVVLGGVAVLLLRKKKPANTGE